MKRVLIKAQLLLFGHCYCASPRSDLGNDLRDLVGIGLPVPVKSWAERSARRREAATGAPWNVTKWGRKYPTRMVHPMAVPPDHVRAMADQT